MKIILQGALFLSAGFIGSAQANSIGFNTDSFYVNIGEKFEADIYFELNTESLGGTFMLSYNNQVLTNPIFNFEPDSVLGEFGVEETAVNGETDNSFDINFGTLSFTTGILGAGLLGHLTFDTIAEGDSLITLKDNMGGLWNFNTFQELPIDYKNTSVNVVPVPAAVWLFASACGLLVGGRKKLNNKLSQV